MHECVVHTSPYGDDVEALVNGVSVGYWPTEKDAIVAGKLADKHGFKTRDDIQHYFACNDKAPSSVATGDSKTLVAEIEDDAVVDTGPRAESKPPIIDVDDSDDDTFMVSGKKRKLSDRFADLEECKKNGYLTDDEYKAKRQMLLASI